MIRRIISDAWPFRAKHNRTISKNDARLFKHISERDVFLTSYPRSGNTWVRYLLMAYGFPDRDLDMSTIRKTIPDLHRGIDEGYFVTAGQRIIKSHSLYCARYPNVICIIRDGRDCYWSFYNYQKHANNYDQSFEVFFDAVMAGNVWPSSWHGHVQSWIAHEAQDAILVVRYEDLLSQPQFQLRKMVEFIGWDWNEALGERATRLASVDRVWSGVQKVGNLGGVRARAGSWREIYSPKMLEDFNRVAAPLLRRLGYEP